MVPPMVVRGGLVKPMTPAAAQARFRQPMPKVLPASRNDRTAITTCRGTASLLKRPLLDGGGGYSPMTLVHSDPIRTIASTERGFGRRKDIDAGGPTDHLSLCPSHHFRGIPIN